MGRSRRIRGCSCCCFHSANSPQTLGAPCLPLLETWDTATLYRAGSGQANSLTNAGCPTLSASLFLRFGWDAANSNRRKHFSGAAPHRRTLISLSRSTNIWTPRIGPDHLVRGVKARTSQCQRASTSQRTSLSHVSRLPRFFRSLPQSPHKPLLTFHPSHPSSPSPLT